VTVAELESHFKMCRPGLIAYAMRYVRNRDDAEDLVQQVFVRSFRHREKYKPIITMMGWFRMQLSHIVSDQRRAKNPPEKPLSIEQQEADGGFHGEGFDVADCSAAVVSQALVDQVLSNLKGTEVIAVKGLMDGDEVRDVARACGVTVKQLGRFRITRLVREYVAARN
jgi:RNA polymerase sigma factor (sigma-70 family)